MGADIAMNLPDDLPFKDWLKSQRLARGWSLPELAMHLTRLARARGTEPNASGFKAKPLRTDSVLGCAV